MEDASPARFVKSLRPSAQIEVSGFERVDNNVHMIEWLRRGNNFRQFITNDIEEELYAQDGGAQLLSVRCAEEPEYKTDMRIIDHEKKTAIVTGFSVTFPVLLQVRSSSGVLWNLRVRHNYQATNVDIPDQIQLRLNFTVVSATQ